MFYISLLINLVYSIGYELYAYNKHILISLKCIQ